VFFWRRRRSSLAGTADRRDGAGARRRRLGLLATASESRRRDVPGGWTDEGTRGATRGWIKNSSARRARRRCVASFGARDARVVMMDGWAHPSVRLGADTTMERHRRLTLRELARSAEVRRPPDPSGAHFRRPRLREDGRHHRRDEDAHGTFVSRVARANQTLFAWDKRGVTSKCARIDRRGRRSTTADGDFEGCKPTGVI